MFVWTLWFLVLFFFFFKQKTAYEMRISDWSSDVCSSDLIDPVAHDDLPGLESDEQRDRLRGAGDEREAAEIGGAERARRHAEKDERQHREHAAAREQPAQISCRRAHPSGQEGEDAGRLAIFPSRPPPRRHPPPSEATPPPPP